MEQRTIEWLRQSEYDLDTARLMFDGGRHFYAVFMCHLAIEKALKGLYYERRRQVPPKVHNLVYLMNESGTRLPDDPGKFIVKLNEANIATRYPENLNQLQRDYTQTVANEMIAKTTEVLGWIKSQL